MVDADVVRQWVELVKLRAAERVVSEVERLQALPSGRWFPAGTEADLAAIEFRQAGDLKGRLLAAERLMRELERMTDGGLELDQRNPAADAMLDYRKSFDGVCATPGCQTLGADILSDNGKICGVCYANTL